MSEHKEQALFFEWVRLNERLSSSQAVRETMELCYAVPNGGRMTIGQSKKMKSEGLTKGILDINLDWPAKEFHGLRLEFKYRAPHETTEKTQKKIESGLYLVDLSTEQKRKRELLIKVGFKVVVVYSAEQAIRAIFEYLPFEATDYQGIKEFL